MAPSPPKKAKTVPASPTQKLSPSVGHIPPFVNSLNTNSVGERVPSGVSRTKANMMAKKPRMCRISIIPSNLASRLRKALLITKVNRITAQYSSVACQFSILSR